MNTPLFVFLAGGALAIKANAGLGQVPSAVGLRKGDTAPQPYLT